MKSSTSKLRSFLNQIIFAIAGLSLFAACQSSYQVPEELAESLPEQVDFNFHIKPILSDRCYACHGQDEATRKGNLRLDTPEGAFANLDSSSWNGHYAIRAGKPSQSSLLERIYATDEAILMPPPESKMQLTDYEKALIAKWIDQGAAWKEHWAFLPPTKAPLPNIKQEDWPANPIDHFVLANLEKQKLSPSPPADKSSLLRRVYFDLTGLPPSPSDIDQFLADNSPEAYTKVVDQLLQSDEYAERMAMNWMDLSRYADSHGMHADGWRMMWPWRDWVIQAFKDNMPYDQFVTWQLAGDLLPHASKEQKLATAFHRNHPMTGEGGVVDEEFRLEYVFDRTNTTATVFLGLTMECARCHDHKFDPISQKEYYQMSAFFNNVKELGMTGDDGNYGPMLPLPDADTEEQIAALDQEIKATEKSWKARQTTLKESADFIQQLKNNPTVDLQSKRHYYPLERLEKKKGKQLVDPPSKASASGQFKQVKGRKGKAFVFGGDYDLLSLNEVGYYEYTQPFSGGAWIKVERQKDAQTILCTAGEKNNFWRGWEFFVDPENRLSLRLIHSLPHNYIQTTSIDSLATDTWQQVFFSYDGRGKANGIKLFVNGNKVKSQSDFDRLYKSILPVSSGAHKPDRRAVRVGKSYRGFTGENGIFHGLIDEIYLYDRQLSELEVHLLADSDASRTIAQASPALLLDHHLLTKDAPAIEAHKKLQTLTSQRLQLLDSVPELMVMEEMPEARPAHVLFRGDYRMKREAVEGGTPQKVLRFPDNAPRNRLGLAQWIVHKDNPLTARVAVNRFWQLFFGQGIVGTPQDFGYQGALPTHPALLDWLALEFQASNWDIKALHKQIVSSATYQQASKTRQDLMEKDPANSLLARGPSHRLSAEMIRDNALAASGLLHKNVGGKSVRPYQPDGLWIDKGTFSHKLLRYVPSEGQDLYRRSLYTFIKRTSPHPAMSAFDAPNRSACTVKRERTNTPLQALILLNDPQFVEPAKVMGQRMYLEAGETLEEKIQFAFRRFIGRKAQLPELELFSGLYQDALQTFKKEPAKAKDLLAVGAFQIDPTIDPIQTAAYTLLASTMINMDEFYTKR